MLVAIQGCLSNLPRQQARTSYKVGTDQAWIPRFAGIVLEDRCPRCFVVHGALDVRDSDRDEVGTVFLVEKGIGPEENAIGPEESDDALDTVL